MSTLLPLSCPSAEGVAGMLCYGYAHEGCEGMWFHMSRSGSRVEASRVELGREKGGGWREGNENGEIGELAA